MCVKQPSEAVIGVDAKVHEIVSTGDQTVYSPLSLLVLLASLLGAKAPQGQTESQLRNGFLSLQKKPDNNLASFDIGDQYVRQVMTSTRCNMQDTTSEDAPPIFCIANSMIIAERFEKAIKRAFIDKMTNDYQFQYSTVTIDTINAWVEKNTNGMIKNFLQEIPFDTAMLLMNTLYFKGQWEKTLDPVRNVMFESVDGQKYPMDRVGKTYSFPYLRDEERGFHVINLPFRRRFGEMQVPLDADVYAQLVPNLVRTPVNFEIPKFRVESKHKLKPILQAVGVDDLFSRSKANLSGMSDLPLFVSAVEQAAVLELNEYGLEASAVTQMTIMSKSLLTIMNPIPFICDQPFSFVLYDKQTNKIAFVGKYNRPTQ
ncbi:Serpin peptidase inhibitor, clade B (Ovalbumin), member [Cichlidogyrus casuarinus]|uniref:Serpin peptidase inhibitor, clade B (Ovalbumin), member n=1 Tax=Cichlidogyrus casuarinus TaxID=1844966 RepID=A0ABD2PSR7_9PLAT